MSWSETAGAARQSVDGRVDAREDDGIARWMRGDRGLREPVVPTGFRPRRTKESIEAAIATGLQLEGRMPPCQLGVVRGRSPASGDIWAPTPEK